MPIQDEEKKTFKSEKHFEINLANEDMNEQTKSNQIYAYTYTFII